MPRDVAVEEVRTGRVLCMPEVTGQERAVICAKSVHPRGTPVLLNPFDEGAPAETYDTDVVRLGVYPAALSTGVEYFVFSTSATVSIDDPLGVVGRD